MLAAVLLPTSSAVAADPGMPNVIFVMADSPEPSSMLVSPMQAADPGVVKVVFLQADSATDNGWNAASWRGIQELGKLGVVTKTGDYSFDVALVSGGILEVKTVTNIGYNAGDIERVARSVVENGANMVVGTWFDSAFALAMLAEEYPDVKFVHISGYPVVKSNGRNFSTYFAKQEQADYAVCAAIARA